MARYGSPEKRIRRILNEGVLSRGVTIGSVLVIAALAFPLAYVTAAVREAGPQIVKAPVVAATPVVPANAGTAAVPPALAKEAQGTEAGRQQATTTRATTTTKETKSTQDTAGPIRRYVIVQGSDRMSGSWDSDTDDMNDLRTRYGDRFAWFRQNGHEYVITDAGVLAEFDKAMEPQKNVNRMQNEVNGEQSRVNGMQAQVNAHQNDVNALQGEVNRRQNLVNEIQNAVNRQDNATLVQKTQELQQMAASKPEANQAAVNRKQAEVNQEQSGVNGEQSKVNAMQSKVNDEQHRVNAEFNKKMQDIFGSALQKGLAKEVK